jgi:AraC family transcriptional regulator
VTPNLGKLAAIAARPGGALPARPSGYHQMAGSDGFAVHDCVCRHTPRSPPLSGQYGRTRIAVMLAGAFAARTSQGAAVVGPGALLLVNAGSLYEYRHVDEGGDRSIVFEYEPALLAEVARSMGGRAGHPRLFEHAAVAASPASADAVALAREALCTGQPEALREAAFAVAAIACAADRTGAGVPLELSSRQARRVAQALRYIDAHSAGDCSLETLAAQARLSSFHFLRLFRALTGQTPRQVVIATRLRAAATALRSTRARIVDVALEVGFGDLSHFTSSFTRAFGTSPRRYRRRAQPAPPA